MYSVINQFISNLLKISCNSISICQNIMCTKVLFAIYYQIASLKTNIDNQT